MDMIRHYNVAPYFKSFVGSTVSKTINDYIPVNFPGENIYPIHYSKGEEIGAGWVSDVTSGGHETNLWSPRAISRLLNVYKRKKTLTQSKALLTPGRRSTDAQRRLFLDHF
jgi:hypothetical protein